MAVPDSGGNIGEDIGEEERKEGGRRRSTLGVREETWSSSLVCYLCQTSRWISGGAPKTY